MTNYMFVIFGSFFICFNQIKRESDLMNYQQVAEKILENIGGEENIVHFEHCSTRVRFTLADNSKVNKEEIERIEGVLTVRLTGQCQVVIGNEVVEVYDEVIKIIGNKTKEDNEQKEDEREKRKIGAVILDFIVGVFQPLVPAIAGGGILKSLLMLLSLIGVMDSNSEIYKIFTLIGDAPLYFLPLLVAITAANKLRANSLVAVSIVAVLLLPDMMKMMEDSAQLFGFGLRDITYAYQVFPSILTVLLYAYVEKLWTKVSPKPIRIFFVPMMSMVITAPIALLLLGPFGYTLGQGFTSVILTMFNYVGWLAVAILAALLPFMVATGMHKAMLPYAITTLGETGKELLYLPASLAHNIAESGASFAVALKTKDKKLKATAISAGISALFGITEPALYGVTIQNKKVLGSVMIGSFIGGSFIGIMGVQAFVPVGPGLASLTMFISEDLPMNILYAIIGLIISFIIAFATVFLLFRDKKDYKQNSNKDHKNSEIFNTPVKGEILSLNQVNDDVFSSGVMGDGYAINPLDNIVYAPLDGEISMLFNTKHAIGLQSTNGSQILIHIGIDTVQLNGKYFKTFVEKGAKVNQGDKLIEFDLDAIKESGFDPTIICIVTNTEEYILEKTEFDLKDTSRNKIIIKKVGV